MSVELAGQLGELTTAVVAAAVGAAVAGSVGGAVGGAMSGSAAPGSPAPVQNLIAKVQFAAMTGNMATDTGSAHKAFADNLKWITLTEGGMSASDFDAKPNGTNETNGTDTLNSGPDNQTVSLLSLLSAQPALLSNSTDNSGDSATGPLWSISFFLFTGSFGLCMLYLGICLIWVILKFICGCGGSGKALQDIGDVFMYLFLLVVSTLHLGSVDVSFAIFNSKALQFTWIFYLAIACFLGIGLGWPFWIWWKMRYLCPP
jgi:hypothetical protein